MRNHDPINAAPPKRLAVINALQNLLATISMENGYNVDLEKRVAIGIAEFGEEFPTPMLSILEAPMADIGDFAGANGHRKESWTLLVQGWIGDDPFQPTRNAYYLAADVEKCLSQVFAISPNSGRPVSSVWYRLGNTGMINDLSMAPPVVRPPEGGSRSAWFYMPIRIDLSVNTQNPYQIGV